MKISIQEVKTALRDPEFRKKLPEELKLDVQKYEQNPSCGCNLPIYQRILKIAPKQLKDYFPGREVETPEEKLLMENHWKVINCHVNELEQTLKNLPSGRKQVAVARYEDQVTVIVNELDILV